MTPRGVADAEARAAFLNFFGGNHASSAARLRDLLPNHDALEAQAAWISAFEVRIAEGVPLKRGVFETVSSLHAAGMPMVVVTSSHRVHAEHNLGATGLLDFFSAIVPGDEVTHSKPDPEPYVTGAGLLGLSPSDCAAFEDSDAGITAAMAAGCRAVQVPDLRPPGKPFPALGQGHATTLREAVMSLGLLAV